MKRNYAVCPFAVWTGLFVIIPLFIVLYYGFTVVEEGRTVFSLENCRRLADPLYLGVLGHSFLIAAETTFICLILGYPMAMVLNSMDPSVRNRTVLFFVLPMWMNCLLRTYAWMTILGKNGILNTLLSFLKLKNGNFLYTEGAVLLGMVYNFIPFMILPIYTSLSKIEKNLTETAEDLGANGFVKFRRIIFPLSIPGVITGITMVFMPAVSTFVISSLLGGGQYVLIGNLIEQQFIVTGDWNFGSALSTLMMIVILISMFVIKRYDKEEIEEGAKLW